MSKQQQQEPKRLKAIIEIVGGEVVVFPVGESDASTKEILDALRIYFGDTEEQSRK